MSETIQEKKNYAKPVMGKISKAMEVLSLRSLASNIPFLLFIGLLALLYITNTNKAISFIKQTDKNKEAIKELKWQYLDLQSQLIYATSESQIADRAISQGIKPLEKPAFEIKNIVRIKNDK